MIWSTMPQKINSEDYWLYLTHHAHGCTKMEREERLRRKMVHKPVFIPILKKIAICMHMCTHDHQMIVTETSKTINLWGRFVNKIVIYWIAILFIGITVSYWQVFWSWLKQPMKQPPYILLIYYLKHCREFVRKIQHEGACRDKYSTRQSQVLYLSWDTSLSAVFFVQMSTGSALGDILYFELLLSRYYSWAMGFLSAVTLNELGLWICVSRHNVERAKAI